jgi:lysozyme
MRPIPPGAAAFVAEHEGLRLVSYQDSGGVWTVGYGHTGPEVHAGMKIPLGKAKAFLAADLKIAASRLHAVVKREVIDELTENQYAALLSFVFNLGATASWTIWKRLNARQFDDVPVQMMRFVYVGKVKLKGLVNRRAAEVALWSTDEPGSVEDEAPPSSVTRVESTPPAVASVTPATKSGTALTGAAQVVGGLSAGGLAVQQTIAPHAQSAEVLGKVVAGLAVFMALCGVILLAIKWLEKRRASQ